MEEVLFAMDRNMAVSYTSEVRIYDGKGESVKVLTLTNSVGQDQMRVEFVEENTPRKKLRKK